MERDQLLSRREYLPPSGSSGEEKEVERVKIMSQDNFERLNVL